MRTVSPLLLLTAFEGALRLRASGLKDAWASRCTRARLRRSVAQVLECGG